MWTGIEASQRAAELLVELEAYLTYERVKAIAIAAGTALPPRT